MNDKRILNLLQRICTSPLGESRSDAAGELYVQVRAQGLTDVVAAMVDEGFVHHLTAITGQREDPGCRLLYHFWGSRRGITLEIHCQENGATVPSLTGILPGANWYEREVHEMYGIIFSGHPNLVPLLLPEDWEEGDSLPLGEEEER